MSTVPAALHGGPEHGRHIQVPTDSTGMPTARHAFPAPLPAHTTPRPGQLPPLLVYERLAPRADGIWRYHYVGAENPHDT